MIELYYWPTPNGHKITMFLKRRGWIIRSTPSTSAPAISSSRNYLAFSPNNRMPAIIDRAPADGGEPVTVFESGAILLYLADKTRRFIPTDLPAERPSQNGCSGRWAALGRWRARTIISGSMRRRISPTPSIATSTRQIASTASWTVGSPGARSSPETTTASPTWRPIRGSCLGSASSRTWTTSLICAAGLISSVNDRLRSAPMPRANRYSTQPAVTEEGKKLLFGQTAASVAEDLTSVKSRPSKRGREWLAAERAESQFGCSAVGGEQLCSSRLLD